MSDDLGGVVGAVVVPEQLPASAVPEQKEVSISDATPEELKAFLAEARETAFAAEAGEVGQTESVPKSAETSTPEPVAQEGEKDARAQAADLERQNAELQKRAREQEERIAAQKAFIDRRNNEYGELRKQLRAAQARLQEGIRESFDEDPVDATSRVVELKKTEEALRDLDQEEAEFQRISTARQAVEHYVPGGLDVEGIKEILLGDNLAEDDVATVLTDPYRMMSPDALVHLAKRAQERRLTKEIVVYARKLLAENEELKKRPQAVLSEVKKAAQQPQMLNGSVGGRKSVNADFDPTKASVAELKAFIASARQQ